MWKIIADDLERSIQDRTLVPGDKLPTEHALEQKYYVTRHMVRHALKHLADRGLIDSHQGRGSFVRRPTLPIKIQRRTRFGEMVQQAQASHVHRTRRLETLPIPPDAARAFGINRTTPVICLERISIVNGQPTGIGTHYFLAGRFPNFISEYEKVGSITAALKAQGVHDYVRAQTRITARPPSAEDCELLDMPRHVPLIVTQAVNHDTDGIVLEYGEARMASDRVELMITPDEISR